MNTLYRVRKMAIAVSGVMSMVLGFHAAVMFVQSKAVGATPGCSVDLLALMGLACLQSLILAVWCFEYIRREERVLDLYQDKAR